MSGEVNLSADRDKLEILLDEQLKKIGIPNINYDKEGIEDFFKMSRADLYNLPKKELDIYAILLSKMSWYVKKQEDRCRAILTWLENRIRQLTVEEWTKYCDKFAKWEEKMEKTCSCNDFGKELIRNKSKYETMLKDIEGDGNMIKFIAQTVREAKYHG